MLRNIELKTWVVAAYLWGIVCSSSGYAGPAKNFENPPRCGKMPPFEFTVRGDFYRSFSSSHEYVSPCTYYSFSADAPPVSWKTKTGPHDPPFPMITFGMDRNGQYYWSSNLEDEKGELNLKFGRRPVRCVDSGRRLGAGHWMDPPGIRFSMDLYAERIWARPVASSAKPEDGPRAYMNLTLHAHPRLPDLHLIELSIRDRDRGYVIDCTLAGVSDEYFNWEDSRRSPN